MSFVLFFVDNNLSISWHDPAWIPILNPTNIMDYFSERSNPFYDRSCNNEHVKMQRFNPDHLQWVSNMHSYVCRGSINYCKSRCIWGSRNKYWESFSEMWRHCATIFSLNFSKLYCVTKSFTDIELLLYSSLNDTGNLSYHLPVYLCFDIEWTRMASSEPLVNTMQWSIISCLIL